jgi:hypothetical protein
MIGEFLYKYTRRTIGKGHGDRRHKRFFWVHPYTKTLYWSSADPGSSNVSESSAKSGMCSYSVASITFAHSLLSLHRRSSVCSRSQPHATRPIPVQRYCVDCPERDEDYRPY